MGDSMLRAAIAAVSLVVALPAAAQAPAAPPPAVVVAKVELRDLTRQKEFVGRIKAIDSVALRARVERFLRERRFTEGQDVKPGDVLFLIEPDQFQAEVDSAKAEVAKAEATIKDTAAQLARARELIRNQNIAQSTVDQRPAAGQPGRAQASRAQPRLHDHRRPGRRAHRPGDHHSRQPGQPAERHAGDDRQPGPDLRELPDQRARVR